MQLILNSEEGATAGIVQSYATAILPGSLLPYAQAAALLIVVAILYVRPQGLFGQRAEAI